MSNPSDDWEKPRNRGTHLTEAEIQFLRKSCASDTRARDAARQLKCSTRVVNKWYSIFRGTFAGYVRRKKAAPPPPEPKMEHPSVLPATVSSFITPIPKHRLMAGRA